MLFVDCNSPLENRIVNTELHQRITSFRGYVEVGISVLTQISTRPKFPKHTKMSHIEVVINNLYL